MSYNIVRPGGLTNKPGGKNEIIVEQGEGLIVIMLVGPKGSYKYS